MTRQPGSEAGGPRHGARPGRARLSGPRTGLPTPSCPHPVGPSWSWAHDCPGLGHGQALPVGELGAPPRGESKRKARVLTRSPRLGGLWTARWQAGRVGEVWLPRGPGRPGDTSGSRLRGKKPFSCTFSRTPQPQRWGAPGQHGASPWPGRRPPDTRPEAQVGRWAAGKVLGARRPPQRGGALGAVIQRCCRFLGGCL